MNYLKMIGLAAMVAMTLTGFSAGSASATTIEVNGVTQTGAVAVSASVETGVSLLWQLTNGSFANTCTASTFTASTTTFTAESSQPIGGPVSAMSFTTCTTSPITVDKRGSLSFEWISGTTNGTLRSVGTEATVPSPIGNLNCKTGEGTDIGTVTGKSTGQTATIDIKAVINCGFLAPSVTWTGSYQITNPTGFGFVR